ncbi:MAG: hypothetical protein ACREC0_10310 [Methylocella sp.]
MTKPTGNPRGRPTAKKIALSDETAAFFRAVQNSQLSDGGDRRFLRCCEELKQKEKIDVLAKPAAAIWLEAVFTELEFRFLCETATMSFCSRKQTRALVMRGLRAQRCFMLMARSYECATDKKATLPWLNKKKGWDGPFLRFAAVIVENSQCPILRPRKENAENSIKGLIERALKLRDDAQQREFENLALSNVLWRRGHSTGRPTS